MMNALDQVLANGKFKPDWESLKQYRVPPWYQDAKFGIFIHWGIYSVPGFKNEWYPRNMYIPGSDEFKHHIATYGPHRQFGYKDFIPQFKAEKFDPEHWADVFKRSGARYVVPVAEHHDGFQMYDSALSRWNATKMGPKRDIIGELGDAIRKQGLVFGVSSHRAEHWWFMNGGKTFDSDVQDPAFDDFYGPAMPSPNLDDKSVWANKAWKPAPDEKYLKDWLARTCELVDKYQPQIFYFDGWIEQDVFAPYLQQFAAYYYNRGEEWGRGVAINYKNYAFPEGIAVFDVERGQLAGIRPMLWQTDTALGKHSWGYVNDQEYKTVDDVVDDLVDIVSKNGTLLLNFGPHPNGTIPPQDEQILLGIGDWLAINGEAIYETQHWTIFGEGPTKVVEGHFTDTNRAPYTGHDIRFTTKGSDIYAIALAWPGEQLAIKSLGTGSGLGPREIGKVQLLGHPDALTWTRDEAALTVRLPAKKPGDHAFAFKITGA